MMTIWMQQENRLQFLRLSKLKIKSMQNGNKLKLDSHLPKSWFYFLH